MKAKEINMEAKGIWNIVGPVSCLVQSPTRVILVVVREVSSRDNQGLDQEEHLILLEK